jgi:hypothetical protein
MVAWYYLRGLFLALLFPEFLLKIQILAAFDAVEEQDALEMVKFMKENSRRKTF